MDQRLLFKLFLIHASEETQRTLIVYTIEYLKWRYGIKTFEEVQRVLTIENKAGALTKHSTEVV